MAYSKVCLQVNCMLNDLDYILIYMKRQSFDVSVQLRSRPVAACMLRFTPSYPKMARSPVSVVLPMGNVLTIGAGAFATSS